MIAPAPGRPASGRRPRSPCLLAGVRRRPRSTAGRAASLVSDLPLQYVARAGRRGPRATSPRSPRPAPSRTTLELSPAAARSCSRRRRRRLPLAGSSPPSTTPSRSAARGTWSTPRTLRAPVLPGERRRPRRDRTRRADQHRGPALLARPDPQLAGRGDAVADALGAADPDHADQYRPAPRPSRRDLARPRRAPTATASRLRPDVVVTHTGLRLPRRALRARAGRHLGHRPRDRAVPARLREVAATAIARRASRRSSPSRHVEPEVAEALAARPRPDDRRARPRRERAATARTTVPSCAPNLAALRAGLGCS